MSSTKIVTVDGFDFQYRLDDYINLTKMCKQANRKLNHYLRTKSSIDFLDKLSKRINISKENLVLIKRGGTPTKQGTLGHPLVALHLAQWCSTDLYVDISLSLFQYLNTDSLISFKSTSNIKETSGFVYLIQMTDTTFYKIGYSRNVFTRLSNLQTGSPLKLQIIERVFSLNAIELEGYLHNYYSKYNFRGEWFELSKEDVKEFLLVANQLDKKVELDQLTIAPS